MSDIGDEVRDMADRGMVKLLKAGYAEDYPDKDERLAKVIEDALIGFRYGGATLDQSERIGLALASGLVELGVTFTD